MHETQATEQQAAAPTRRDPRRAAGGALVAYGVLSILAFVVLEAPGGDYTDDLVTTYLAGSHRVVGFVAAYVGLAGALCLWWFGRQARSAWPVGGMVGDLALVGAAVSSVGWFVDGGVLVSMAEGGHAITSGTGHPTIYVLTETGNLLAVCAPALFAGVAAIVLAARASVPGWLRGFSYVAGVCGILAPLFFTLFVFTVWTITMGAWAFRKPVQAEGSWDLTAAAPYATLPNDVRHTER